MVFGFKVFGVEADIASNWSGDATIPVILFRRKGRCLMWSTSCKY